MKTIKIQVYNRVLNLICIKINVNFFAYLMNFSSFFETKIKNVIVLFFSWHATNRRTIIEHILTFMHFQDLSKKWNAFIFSLFPIAFMNIECTVMILGCLFTMEKTL